MTKHALLLILLVNTGAAAAQSSKVTKYVKASYAQYEAAFEHLEAARNILSDAFRASTIAEIQGGGSRAGKHLKLAKKAALQGATGATKAAEEASLLNCDDTAEQADATEEHFTAAYAKFGAALSLLALVENEEDDAQLTYYLSRAKDFINEALKELNKAVETLNKSLEDLVACS